MEDSEAVIIEMVDLDSQEEKRDYNEEQNCRSSDSFDSYRLTREEEAEFGEMSYQQLSLAPSAEQAFGEEHDLNWEEGELSTLMQLCTDLCQIDSTVEESFIEAARFGD